MPPACIPLLVLVSLDPAAGERRDVTPWGALALLLVLLGAHAVLALSARLRAWVHGGRKRPWALCVTAALRLGVVWATMAALVAVITVPAAESDGMGAAAAVMLILGGMAFGSYALTLAAATLVGFVRLHPEAEGAPWKRHALVSGMAASVAWVLLCPSPFVVLGESRATPPQLVGLLLAATVFDVAVVALVFRRACRPPAPVASVPRGWRVLAPGIQAVAVLSLLWTLVVPMMALRLFGGSRPGGSQPGNPALLGPGLALWLVPALLTLGLLLRQEWARRLALVLSGAAVLVYGLHLLRGLPELDPLALVAAPLLMLLFGWPLWYLGRPAIRKGFETQAKGRDR